jgi:hypothetical protein
MEVIDWSVGEKFYAEGKTGSGNKKWKQEVEISALVEPEDHKSRRADRSP